jgi:6-phosphogluconolactonase
LTASDTHVFDSVKELQGACASQVAEALRPSAKGKRVMLALSGGSTPRGMHQMLAGAEGIDWSNVHIFWGDERTVPPDDPESNFRMAKESLLDHIDIPDENVHRMRGEIDPAVAASEYEQEIRRTFGIGDDEFPKFDVILLGMGADGHTASLFPGTDALNEQQRLVVANRVPQLETTRLTLTYPVLNNARLVLFLVAGDDKADAAAQCTFSPQPPPAGRVQAQDGDIRWLLDTEAARQITGT